MAKSSAMQKLKEQKSKVAPKKAAKKETKKAAKPASKKKVEKTAPKKESKKAAKVATKKSAKKAEAEIEIPSIEEINAMKMAELNALHSELPEELDNWGDLKAKQKRLALIEALHDQDEVDAELEETDSKVVPMNRSAKKGKVDKNDLVEVAAHEVENLSEEEAFEQVVALSEDIDFNCFKLGGVLSVIDAKKFFGEYDSFRELVESEFGIQYRKARYFVDIYNNILSSGVPWKKLQHIGWTKLREISHLLTEDNVDEWIEKCESMNTETLKAEVKALTIRGKKSGAKKTVSNTLTMTFKLHEDQRDNVDAAIEAAMEALGTDVRSQALEHICLDYLAGDTKKATRVMTAKEFLQKLLDDADGDQEEAMSSLMGSKDFKKLFPDIQMEDDSDDEDESDDEEEELEDDDDLIEDEDSDEDDEDSDEDEDDEDDSDEDSDEEDEDDLDEDEEEDDED